MVNKCNLGGYFGFFPHTKKDKILPVMTPGYVSGTV